MYGNKVYDGQCALCSSPKEIKIKDEKGNVYTSPWGYAIGVEEELIEAYCTQCGIQYAYPWR